MPDHTPKEIYLADYQVPDFLIDTIELTVDLHANQTEVTSCLQLRRNPNSKHPTAALHLDGDELQCRSIHLNDQQLSDRQYQLSERGLTIPDVPEQFELRIVSLCHPEKNTKLSGLYQSNQLYCTQCEAHGFRRISYYLDRPDVLAVFTTKIIADKSQYPTLLANGNLIEQGELPDGRHYATWHDPFKKPAYLFALVAGELECLRDQFRTADDRNIDLRIYVEPGNLERSHHAMWSLKESMRWDEDRYGRIYDLDIFMIVAVRDFNFGAMENKGLNIFNEKYILADPETATDQDYLNIARVVAHEYFHNWSGNRVTCRDWFQLSLKEGLTVFRDQSFSEDLFGRDVNRIEQVNTLRTAQFAEDAGPMAHPVRPDHYVEINNFYTLTVYEKGAELIRMQQQLLGAEQYRRGTDLYFERHDGQAVTCDDFVACMAEVSGHDLSQFKRWYAQAGTPVLTISTELSDAKRLVLQVKQHCPDTPGQSNKLPLSIPLKIALFAGDGTPLPVQLTQESPEQSQLERVFILHQAEHRFEFANTSSETRISLLRGFSAPVKLAMTQTGEDLQFLIQHETDGFNRWEALFQYHVLQLQRLQADPTLQPELNYLQCIQALLSDTSIAPELLAMMLTLPSTNYLAEQQQPIDVDGIRAARKKLKLAIATHCQATLEPWINRKQLVEPYQFTQAAIGQRAMRFVALSYLASLLDSEHGFEETIRQCFQQANNMTDQFNVLLAINDSERPLRQALLDCFYQQWQQHALVVDKWLRLQATADLSNTLETVESLLQHPAFNLKNPNNVYALLGGLISNLGACHRADGAGYQLLQRQITALNTLNPQVAARVITPLTKWRRFDSKRQQRMQAVLRELAALDQLSADLYEVIHRSLAD